MDVILTYDREAMDALDSAAIMTLIEKHEADAAPTFETNLDYYEGKHAILDSQRAEANAPNTQTVCNHAKDISDTASGYFMGNPIAYRLASGVEGKDEAFDTLMDLLDKATVDDDDQENALMLSICGKTYEYIYQAEDTDGGEAYLDEKPIDPQSAFIVYDQSIEHKELFGVYYYRKKNDVDEDDEETEYLYVLVMTETELKYYKLEDGSDEAVDPYEVQQHNLGYIPLVEYKNNRFAIGDFAQQISLIDAYNTMTSDRINDKQQFIDAILVLYGAMLGDTQEEADEAMDDLRQRKLLEMPEGSRAEYLVRQLDEGGMEILRNALKEDIYTFSHVPNLTDEHFSGNSSGVAMEYKLLGLEMLTKTKERWYRRGLRKRLKIFLHFMGLKGGELEESDIDITFSRSLPKNLLELSQIVTNLSGAASQKTLLGLLPFVEDPTAELEEVKTEKEEAVKLQQELFAQTAEAGAENTPPEEEEEDEDLSGQQEAVAAVM